MRAATYSEPRSVAEALGMLAELGPQAGIIAGGTDLIVASRAGKKPLPSALIAIHRLDELRAFDHNSLVRLGALFTHGQVESSNLIQERFSALSDASKLVGSPATRHVGTIGGNVCNASPAMEAGGPLLIFEARVELVSESGVRILPFDDFVLGPGETALLRGELLTGITVNTPPEGSGSAYVRLEYRRAMEIALVGAATFVSFEGDGSIGEARIGLTAVAPTCIRATTAEELLRAEKPTQALLAEAARLAAGSAQPIGDVRAPATYRLSMVEVMVRRALGRAIERARRR